MTDAEDAQVKTLPDKVRFLEARYAHLNDRLEVLESKRTTWVPSRSFSNLTGRQREVVFFVSLCVLGECIHLLMRRLDAPAA